MVVAVQILEALARNVRVDLCGAQIAMAQQQLDDTQISTAVQQMRRKCVAQAVR